MEASLRQKSHQIEVRTPGRGLIEITAAVARFVADGGIGEGLLTVFCRHTSASLTIQENADPTVRADLEAYFSDVVPEAPGRYRHGLEGPDDMPAHIRTALTDVSLSIPVVAGAMVLGTWQGIYLFEHRTAPHLRRVALHLVGE